MHDKKSKSSINQGSSGNREGCQMAERERNGKGTHLLHYQSISQMMAHRSDRKKRQEVHLGVFFA